MVLYFLGTSHGVPEGHRRCSCTMIEINGSLYFIDMGTDIVTPMRKLGKKPSDVKTIAITHPHGDHTDGLVPFCDIISWYFTDSNPTVITPVPEFRDVLLAWGNVTQDHIREDIPFKTTAEGVVYEDENMKLTAYGTKHCDNSFAYLMEAEGKKILFTGDLSHPSYDMPKVIFEETMDLVICEAAHFSAKESIEIIDKAMPKQVIFNHIAPYNEPIIAKLSEEGHPYPIRASGDDMVIAL